MKNIFSNVRLKIEKLKSLINDSKTFQNMTETLNPYYFDENDEDAVDDEDPDKPGDYYIDQSVYDDWSNIDINLVLLYVWSFAGFY